MQIGFFTPIAAMEDGSGFQIGSPLHFVYLAYSALLIAVVVLVYRHLRAGTEPGSPRRTMILIVGLLPFCLKLSEIAIMIGWGVYDVYWWPLHPCNICVMLMAVYALWPNKPSGEILYALGIPGAAAGLLFADWIKRTTVPLNWFCWCGFTEHALLVAFPLMLILAHDFKPSFKRIWQPIAFVAVCVPIFRVFNDYYGTNYWFVNKPSPGSPLELWANVWGDPGYLIPYAMALLVLWVLMYLPWGIREHRAKKHRRIGEGS